MNGLTNDVRMRIHRLLSPSSLSVSFGTLCDKVFKMH